MNPIEWGTGGLLTIAVHHDRPEILALLLDLGFEPNERVRLTEVEEMYYSQAFPLWHCACRWGRFDVANLLLARGADPVEADAEPWARPRAWAEKMRHATLLALVETHGRSPT